MHHLYLGHSMALMTRSTYPQIWRTKRLPEYFSLYIIIIISV